MISLKANITMSELSPQALAFQARMVSLDSATMKFARALLEKDKLIHQLQAKVESLENECRAIKMAKVSSNDVSDDDVAQESQNGDDFESPTNVENLKNVEPEPQKQKEKQNRKQIEIPTESSDTHFDGGSEIPPLSAGFVPTVSPPPIASQIASPVKVVASQIASPVKVVASQISSPVKDVASAVRVRSSPSRVFSSPASSKPVKFIPFFSFCRPIRTKKVIFSRLGRLGNDCSMFVPPENYLQMTPTTSDLENSESGQKKRLESEEDEHSVQRKVKSGQKKKPKTSVEEPSSKQKKKRNEEIVEEELSSVSVPKKTKNTQDKSSAKKSQEQIDSPDNTKEDRFEENDKSSSAEENAKSSSGPAASIKTPTNQKKTATENKRRRSSSSKSRAPQFTVAEYIPLGVAHSTLATPTERIATPIGESKIMKDKKKLEGEAAKTPETSVPSAKPATPILRGRPVNRLLGIKIPPRAPEKTTFAKPVVSKAKLAAIATTKPTDAASTAVPTPPPPAQSTGRVTKEVSVSQNAIPEIEKAAPTTEVRHLELPDTSKPPPNMIPSNRPQLPDLTQLPPSLKSVGESEKPKSLTRDKSLNESDNSSNKILPTSESDCSVGDISKKTFLESMMEAFQSDKESNEAKLAEIRKKNELKEEDLKDQVDSVKAQLGRLWKFTGPTQMASIVELLGKVPAEKTASRRQILVQCVYMAARDEFRWEKVRRTSPNHPPLTVKQTKLFALLSQLEREEIFSGIIEQFLEFVRYNMVATQDRIHSFRLYQLANLTRMYVTFCRYKSYENTARLFLYDVFFQKNARTHVIVSIFLDAWPQILHKPQGEGRLDPLAETVIWLTYNTGPLNNKNDMKVFEARNKLKENCGFVRHDFTGTKFVQYLIRVAEENINNDDIKNAVRSSILLMARWQDFKWVNNNVVSPLLNVMMAKFNQETFLCWVVDAIAHVSRVYTSQERNHLIGIFDPIMMNLRREDISEESENVHLVALIWIGHHLQAQVAKFFTSWHPRHPLRPEVEALVRNYVGSRALTFGQNLITGIKKNRITNMLNAK